MQGVDKINAGIGQNESYLEKHSNFTRSNVRMIFWVVNQHWNFLRTNLIGTISEYEQHGVNNVAFARSIGANDRSETFVKWTKSLLSGVRFEVFVFNVGYNQSRSFAFKSKRWRRRRRNINTIDVNSTILVSNFILGTTLNNLWKNRYTNRFWNSSCIGFE